MDTQHVYHKNYLFCKCTNYMPNSIYSRAAITLASLDRKSLNMERNTMGQIFPVQFSLFNPEIIT